VKEAEALGTDPTSNLPVFVMDGRFGPYVQLGEKNDENKKPRRASIPKDIEPNSITLEQALKLLSLPRALGPHPETGEIISANIGRFGPYVVHQKDFRSLKAPDDVYTVTLERAIEIFKEPKKFGRGRKKKEE
jgi:DNA topoisomerase-1